MNPSPITPLPLKEPLVESIREGCGVYLRSVLLIERWTMVPQHRHDHDHLTLIAAGSARGWANGALIGDREAGDIFEIRAGADHVFMALEPNTRLVCVHNIESAESVKAKGI